MTTRYLAACVLASTLFATPGIVQAQPQTAVTARTVNLRAGPATDYPIVAVLPPGFALAVQGCLPEYTWCDVIAGSSRGWMSAGNINYYYQDRYVPLQNYGAVIGIGALAFILNDYWGSHYRERSWYGERQRWAGRRGDAPGPRYNPAPITGPRPGYVGPRIDRHAPASPPPVPRADRGQRGGALSGSSPIARPARRPGGEPNSGSNQPIPPVTRREQRDLNQGGSSSVDPSQRPLY